MLSPPNQVESLMRHTLFLLLQLAKRDIAARYKGSTLGQLWSLLSPLLLLAVYTFVFSVVFQARWGVLNQSKTFFALNLFVGMILHGFLAESIGRSTSLLHQNQNYIKRIVFPLRLLPLVICSTALFHTAISMLVLLVAVWLLQGALHWHVLLLPFYIAPLLVLTAGLTLAFSALGLFIRDLGQLVPMLTTVLLFTAPVFYPISALPEAYHGWLHFNPLTGPIEMARSLLFTKTLPSWNMLSNAWLSAILTLVVGNFIFQRLRRGFADAI